MTAYRTSAGQCLDLIQQANLTDVLGRDAKGTVSINLHVAHQDLEGQLQAVATQPVGVVAQAGVRAAEDIHSLVGALHPILR